MTIFLCILTMLSLWFTPTIKGSPWSAVAGYLVYALMVLGLATLAVWTWSQP